MMPDNRILVGMSGGVDSTVCCRLLQRAGYSVSGLYCIMSDAHLSQLPLAEISARELGIPMQTADLRERFQSLVTAPFISQYCAGVTPNPCVLCNPLVKFSALRETADAEGIGPIATGHYVRVEYRGEAAVLKKASDLRRDQSYMLYRLPQEILRRLITPLGGYEKDAVRAIAREARHQCSDLPDSQEICFIPDGDYPSFLLARGHRGKEGNFLAPDRTVLRRHKGVEHYTVGQRRGLGVSLGRPVFVRRILASGDIQLAFSGEEYAKTAVVSDLTINPFFQSLERDGLTVKLRSMSEAAACRVKNLPDGGVRVEFDRPQRAPAPGQSAVFYDGSLLAGGGIIEDFS